MGLRLRMRFFGQEAIAHHEDAVGMRRDFRIMGNQDHLWLFCAAIIRRFDDKSPPARQMGAQ